jgi:hypothetical protein
MAACRFEDPELFFLVSDDGSSLLQGERTKQIWVERPGEHTIGR